MPDNKNNQQGGNQNKQQQSNAGQDQNQDRQRQSQGNQAGQGGDKRSTEIEKDDRQAVGQPHRDPNADQDQDRQPQGNQGRTDQMDRDRNKQ